MAGLVSYASSDEDSGDEQPRVQAPAPSEPTQPQPQPQLATATASKPASTNTKPPQKESPAPGAALPPPGASPLGPSLPPMDTPLPPSTLPEPSPSNPSSPYTTTRSFLHDLTLPSIPNFDIPVSPPRSPSSTATATAKKLEQFLALKKRGTHFNAKLEQSAALRNPALTDKLLQFVDIPPPDAGGERGRQYQTTLPETLWNPDGFPEWACRGALRKSRDRVAKERETARAAPGRSGVEFVSGTTTAGAGGGGGLSKGEKRRGGWQ